MDAMVIHYAEAFSLAWQSINIYDLHVLIIVMVQTRFDASDGIQMLP